MCFANSGVPSGAIVVDVNGDGLPDIIQGSTNASGTNTYASWINTGSGWATGTVWTPPVPFVASGGLDNGTRIADVNGDGLPDILQGYTDATGTTHYGAWVNTGNGWATSTVWNSPLPFMSNGGWDNGVRFASLDGNGLPDIISSYTNISGNPFYASYVNTGSGWATSTVWTPPALFDTDGGYDAGTRIVDVRRDVYAQKGGSYDFPVYTKAGELDSSLALSRTLSQVPTFSVDRVYVSTSIRKQAESWIIKNRDKIITVPTGEKHSNGTPSKS